jgi:hypothetical protein
VPVELFRQLETRAKAGGITVSELVRQKLEADESFAAYLNNFECQMRDTIEQGARGSRDIDIIFGRLANLGAKLRGIYTDVEQLLLPHMTNPKVRELMRGAQQ